MDSSEDNDLSLPSSNVYTCDSCNATFATRSGLWKHNNKLHPELASDKSRQAKLQCGLCEMLLFTQVDLCKHLSEVHSIHAAIRECEFESVDHFSSWKTLQEEKGKCIYTKKRQDEMTTTGTVSAYYCHRSGKFTSKSQGVRVPRYNVTNRCGFQCSAFITAKKDINGRMHVNYCTDHYGHDNLLSRLPLPDSTREQVKSDLIEERDPTWIVKKVRGNFRETDNINRGQMLKKSDVYNIQRACGLRKAEKHSNDMASVAMWVEENDQDAFFCFKPLDTDDGSFILGIQTTAQKEKLLRFGTAAICVDATHGVTHYKNYQLVTIMVITDQGKGYPAAWFIVSNETEEILTVCFKELRKRVGGISTKFFMSDDAGQYWNAWMSAFGDSEQRPIKLLCSWHVKRNWKNNTKTKVPSDYQEAVKTSLDELMAAETEAKFRILQTSFYENLREWNCDDFLKYFRSHYCGTPFRQMEWALYARRESVVNTNTHLEAFHERLKYNFFEGKQNRRMDVLIKELLGVALSYSQDYKLAKETGLPASTYRLRVIHQRHKNSLALRKDQIKPIEGGWLIPSGSQPGRFYFIRRRMAEGDACQCSLICRRCGVCPDLYLCNCLDAVMPTTACKHMHLVQSFFYPKPAVVKPSSSEWTAATSTESEEPILEESFSEVDDVESEYESESESGHRKRNEFREHLSAFMEWSDSAPVLDSNTWAAINTKCKEIATLIRLSATSTVAPALSEEAGPANKNVKRQRRF